MRGTTMRVTNSYSGVLMYALRLIEEGESSYADLLINNFYHRQRRYARDFVQLLRMTKWHRAYVEASDDTKNQLLRILFLLDPKYNQRTHSLFVSFHRETTADGTTVIRFTLEEKRSTPA